MLSNMFFALVIFNMMLYVGVKCKYIAYYDNFTLLCCNCEIMLKYRPEYEFGHFF